MKTAICMWLTVSMTCINGGENAYPREAEDGLCKHHGVIDVAVVGTPDE